MVPMNTLASIRDIAGPVMLTRYNTYPAAPINGEPARIPARARPSPR